jgi:hypothetical protein
MKKGLTQLLANASEDQKRKELDDTLVPF